MRYILVTGGAGYIGSTVTNLLLENNYKVIVVDNLSTGFKTLINKKSKFFKIDLKNYKKLKQILSNYKFDAVFHFAASLSVEESEKKPLKYFDNNVLGTENILKIVSEFKIKKVIFSSTCAVYGNVLKKSGRINETSHTIPESNYGKTKLLCEVLIKNYAKKFNFNYAILRYFNVIGADINIKSGQVSGSTLFKNLCKNIVKKKYKLNIYGNDYQTKDGTCVRDYIDVNDLSECHLLSLKKLSLVSSNFIINCGYNRGHSVIEIVKAFEQVIKKKIKIRFLKRRKGDIEKIVSETSFFKKVFPKWKRKVFLKDSIANSLRWEKKINAKKFKDTI